MNITQLSDDRVLISLCHEDMINFKLDFDTLEVNNPHSKKLLSRLLNLAVTSTGISTKNKSVVLEALENTDGCLILVSLCEKNKKRKKYRIKRIKEYPCFRFKNCDTLLCAIKSLYNTDTLFYNNSAYSYKNKYFLVFDYPVVSKKATKILTEYSDKLKATRPFVARLQEGGTKLASGNAIIHIGESL